MVISTNLGPWVSEDGFLFSEEKNRFKLRLFSGMRVIPFIKHAYHDNYCSTIGIGSDKAPSCVSKEDPEC